jgi:uncharacterized protein
MKARIRALPTLGALVVVITAAGSVSAEPRTPVTSLLEFRQANVVMQKWDISCGAAALATVLTYSLAHPVSEETIARAMLQQQNPERVRQRGGFSLLDLKRFAEHRGFRAGAYRNLTIEHLRRFQAPIVPIETHGYSHFVVIRSIDGDRVQLADPAFGNRQVSLAKFTRVWLGGIGFVVVPRPD